ncbi:ATP synthase subunit I [Rubrivirga sp. S365]|uniref:ATP synthase subunit I n=1 Tax=Rubrivirga litoralis TaxID=3075598 RepID=A0ABU3BM94_9BACT|nr:MULTISPECIES: ATP synthase subunit I [unclassified Rubrivirga]MDT0630397.1 ATP synthase subunit I [Rubrivirga sp. F394]MDT7855908.1 ATP synthase subunit I [Rubrivirga sp. S365]
MTPASSLLIGALLGAANAGAAAWTARRAATLDSQRAIQLVLGGMAVRMALVLVAFALVLATVPVHRGAFVGGLGLLFLVGLAAEVALVFGRTDRPRPEA